MPVLTNVRSGYIQWNAYPGAETYGVIVWKGGGPGGQGIIYTNTAGLNYAVSNLLDCQEYYYEIWAFPQAIRIDNGSWITAKAASVLVYSLNLDGSVDFAWGKCCGSSHQEQWLDIASSVAGLNNAPHRYEIQIGISTFHLSAGVLAPGSYFWRINDKSGLVLWLPSGPMPLTIQGPTPTPRKAAVLRTPCGVNNAGVLEDGTVAVSFAWKRGSGGEGGSNFHMEDLLVIKEGGDWLHALIHVAAGPTDPPDGPGVEVTNFMLSSADGYIFDPGTRYQWLILTNFGEQYPATSANILISNICSFTTIGDEPIPGQRQAPKDLRCSPMGETACGQYQSDGTAKVTLGWIPGSGPDYVSQELEVEGVGLAVDLSPTGKIWNLQKLDPEKTYTWWVRAQFQDGTELETSSTFTTPGKDTPPPVIKGGGIPIWMLAAGAGLLGLLFYLKQQEGPAESEYR